jgi:hypothetical protein
VAEPGRRYLLPALPCLVFWLVVGGGQVIRFVAGRVRAPSRKRVTVVATVLVAMLVAGNMLRISKLVYQARQPSRARFYEVTEGPRMKDLFDLAAWLRQNARPGDVVLAREDRFLHYFSRVRTWPTITPRFARRGFRYGGVLRRLPATLIVRDPEDPTRQLMDAFIDGHRTAVESVARFGELEVLRINRAELSPGGS